MRPGGLRTTLRRGIALFSALALSTSGTARAQDQKPVVVTLTPGSVRVKIEASTLSQAIDALSKAAGFKVTYDGPRPGERLFNTEVVAASVGEAVFRLLSGQNLNYGVVLDPSSRVSSVLILGPAVKAGAAAAASTSTSTSRPQALPTPRFPKTSPDADEQPERAEDQEQPEPAPSPSPSPMPSGTPNRAPNPSPFAPRPLTPYGAPPIARPTPSVSPSP